MQRRITRWRLPRERVAILKGALLVPILIVGIVGFVVIRNQQGQGVTVVGHQQVQFLTPAAVDEVLRNSPDPIGKERASLVSCNPTGSGALRDPWFCVLRFPTGHVIEYSVTINADGSYVGADQFVVVPAPPHRAPGTIDGCCVPVP